MILQIMFVFLYAYNGVLLSGCTRRGGDH